MANNIVFGETFEFLGFECKPYENKENTEDWGIDIYDKGNYVCTCQGLTRDSLTLESLEHEFKLAGITNINVLERWNTSNFGENWRGIYNGL